MRSMRVPHALRRSNVTRGAYDCKSGGKSMFAPSLGADVPLAPFFRHTMSAFH
jgi:hypothetical protein